MIQKKSTWLFCLILSLLYATVVNSYYLHPFSRVLEQAGWGQSLHWMTFSFHLGTTGGSLLLILLIKWEVPSKYLCIASAWMALAVMLVTGYLIVNQVPEQWLLILLQAITGICTVILFQCCLELFHWGIWQKVKQQDRKTSFEQAIGEEQSRRLNLCILLGSACNFLTFWQLGTDRHSHLGWFTTTLAAMVVFALLTLGTIRFPKKLDFPDESKVIASKPRQPISLRKLFVYLVGIYAPSWAMLIAVNTYLQRYLSTFVMIPLITFWGVVVGSIVGTKVASKIAPHWNNVIVLVGFALISMGPVLFWSSKSPIVLAFAMFVFWIGMSFQSVVISRVLLVRASDKQKMAVQTINGLSHHPAMLLIAPIGMVVSAVGLRWMWLTLLVLLPIGIISTKRFPLLQPTEKDIQQRRHTLAGALLGVTLHLARRW